jgi:hypothetical protein
MLSLWQMAMNGHKDEKEENFLVWLLKLLGYKRK